MAKPTPESIAAALTVPERLLLFCLASDTDWQAASITHALAHGLTYQSVKANCRVTSSRATCLIPRR
jgi:hypothetical protein